MIIPFSVQKVLCNDCLFVRLKILCEGGRKFWDENIDNLAIREILSESDFDKIEFKGVDKNNNMFYMINDNKTISDWLELTPQNTDLCWRTFFSVLKTSATDNEKYFFYLPFPSCSIMGVNSIEDIFKYILKVEYNIDIDL